MDFFWNFLTTFLISYAVFCLMAMFLGGNEHSESFNKVVEELEDALLLCRVEQIKDVFYFYNTQDDTFVGQGKNIEDMNDISERLQKHLMVIEGDDQAIANLKNVSATIRINQ